MFTVRIMMTECMMERKNPFEKNIHLNRCILLEKERAQQ